MKKIVVSLFAFAALAACSSSNDAPDVPAAPSPDTPTAADDVSADQVEVVSGIPDRERDPAVVAIDIGEAALCTGSLIAADVVLTARHCVARTTEQIQCPASAPQVGAERAASSLHILVGDDIATAREVARGKTIVAPKGWALCDEDIALIVLDREVPGVAPLAVRRAGIATGDHVRAVGFGKSSDGGPAGVKLLRDHVKVLETSEHEFVVGEATCQGDSGGPALDETTGEVVGVVSRGGPACDGSGVHNVYTRTDVFMPLIDEALREAGARPGGGAPGDDEPDAGSRRTRDGGARSKDAGAKSSKPPTDLGGACKTGRDCSTGVCVHEHGKRYCSRSCDAHDHCPTHFSCKKPKSGASSVCVEK